VFKNTALANYHAEKSGHDQFEESTEEVRVERCFFTSLFVTVLTLIRWADQAAHGRGKETET
jgi:hypothetical protein